jgi:cobalt-zinc-cadmium efflux system protein
MNNHAHDHPTEHALPNNGRAFAIGVALNLSFVIVELVFGFISNSLALISDAGHNFSDVIGLLLAWGASHIATFSPTKRRTYGLRKSSILAALTNSILLLVAVGGIAWEAIHRFAHPEAVASSAMIGVAAVGVLINSATAALFMRNRSTDMNIRGAFLHMAADAVVSLGVVVAGIAIYYTGASWIDPAMSLVIGLVIAVGTLSLFRESVDLSLDAVPRHIDPQAVEAFMKQCPGVVEVHDLHIWALSTTEVALTAHLIMNPLPADDHFLHELSHELKHRFGIGHTTTQIEYGTGEVVCHQAPAHVV